ncbi:MAG: sulfate adenylyltransferase subunit CysN [Candidatus Latescibacteria bacterium]|nr:sulfate adenylyltransferase subunit CysN [Candidatus Latescibacterota bacterium]
MTIYEFLKQNEQKDLLRFSTAGSVDDGKSTLIGRLLHDSKLIYEDHLAALKSDSIKRGTAGDSYDFALLLDGLKAEREQNITIDVAYRYFSTPKRKFIIADTPGHEHYTRNMATGASTADLAVILIDARKGVITQSKRHSFIMSLLGIRHLVVAINKMDLVNYSEDVYEKIKKDFSEFAAKLDIHDITFIPLSALKGDNVVTPGENMPWYRGRPFLDYLETVHFIGDRNLIDLRFPVQYVLRPHQDFRGYSGTVASGILRRGDEIMILPSGRKSRIKSIVTYDGEQDEAFPPMAVTVTLEDEIDVSRGDMFVHPHNIPDISHTFEAMLIWMSEEPMRPDTPYLFKHTMNTIQGEIKNLRYKVDVNTLHREETKQLSLNEIGRTVITLNRPLLYDDYNRNRATGSFIIIDRLSNITVGAGMIIHRRSNELIVDKKVSGIKSDYIHHHNSTVTLEDRMKRLKQRPVTIWLTGLPKSGKSTIAYALEKRLFDMGYTAHVLDGENLRYGISSDLGFSGNDRSENIRRAAEVAKLCNNLGMITIAAFVSPYEEDRTNARSTIGEDRFLDVYLYAPLDECIKRDTEGLYAKAEKGEILNFSGVSAPYEPPTNPSLMLPTHQISAEECVEKIIGTLKAKKVL